MAHWVAAESTSKSTKRSWAAIRARRAKGSNKSLAFGVVERDRNLCAGPDPKPWQSPRWPDPKPFTRHSGIHCGSHVTEGTRLTADEWDSYNDLKHGFDLGRRVNHSKKE